MLVLAHAPTRSARRPVRLLAVVVLLVLAAQAPWLASGLLHAGSATSSGAGARAFALHDEGSLPGPLAALGLGGVWNAEVVPASRAGSLGWVALVLLLLLAVAGARSWGRSGRRRELVAAAALLAGGLGPGLHELGGARGGGVGGGARARRRAAARRVADAVAVRAGPGGRRGVRRGPGGEGGAGPEHRYGGGVGGGGAGAGPGGAAARRRGRAVRAAGAGGLPGVLPAGPRRGGGGAREGDGGRGAVLLPFTAYRAPSWNGGRKVLDPLGRYLGGDVVVDDRLGVSGRLVAGEDPRAAEVRGALALPSAGERARALAAQGIALVVTERDVAGGAPAVAGRPLLEDPDVQVVQLSGVSRRDVPSAGVVVMSVAWLAYLGAVGWGLVRRPRWGRTRWYSSRRT